MPNEWTAIQCVQLICVFVILIAPFALSVYRIAAAFAHNKWGSSQQKGSESPAGNPEQGKPSRPKGMGVRGIQFTMGLMVIPAIVILTTGGFIGKETAAALLGTFIGFVFSNIADFKSRDLK